MIVSVMHRHVTWIRQSFINKGYETSENTEGRCIPSETKIFDGPCENMDIHQIQ